MVIGGQNLVFYRINYQCKLTSHSNKKLPIVFNLCFIFARISFPLKPASTGITHSYVFIIRNTGRFNSGKNNTESVFRRINKILEN